MVCQGPPEPPLRRFYTTLPTNLPARFVPHRIFIVRHNHHNICFPMNSLHKPSVTLTLPRRQNGGPVYLQLRIVGWRWTLADTMDPRVNLKGLGLNVPGVPGYDPELDEWGRAKNKKRKMRQVGQRRTVKEWTAENARTAGKKVMRVLDGWCVRFHYWLERKERRRRREEMEGEDTVKIDLNFERFMKMNQRFWS
ncbi:hypothetical protein H072_9620 [Dactylellina haptotyla CBS 200.50]|uniref:Uncharacterized protein n=1 Tax=Dactylellina haptotyla (strain CBS 200.50) TaxID=1284197 RepID=S8BCE2_DACHA|nr:hypothetical protein H072_9620 [Dactylellina haptotyla CBS 200.50]